MRAALLALRDWAGRHTAQIDRIASDLDALEFQLTDHCGPILVCVIGGTGTGKSTLINRLASTQGVALTAASFRRTFTSGAVAIARSRDSIPDGWTGLPARVVSSTELPAKGEEDSLTIVEHRVDLTERVSLIDTPDIDGDQAAHHAVADRVFRWSEAVIALVSPEKYQMTELRPYLKIARRYALPLIIVMNKLDDRAVADDARRVLKDVIESSDVSRLFTIPRDDSTVSIDPSESIDALRSTLVDLQRPDQPTRTSATNRRLADLAERAFDQVLDPLRDRRERVDRAMRMLRELVAPSAGVDVDPISRDLRRQMQQRSVLYLMGPGKMIDRIRSAPAALARLPRTTIDLIRGKKLSDSESGSEAGKLPDFASIVTDQFRVAQMRIDDSIRSSLGERADLDASWKFDPDRAGSIVKEELANLKKWLEDRAGKDPADTRMIQKLLKVFPGAERLTKYSEAAPYLLTIAFLATRLSPVPVDLIVIGGFSAATWLGEKLSNEVAWRTREANVAINERFAQLVRSQTDEAISALDASAPEAKSLDRLSAALDAAAHHASKD